jgi:UDP-N-acetylmuramoylalanine--D-glutamate ligase
MKTLFTDKRITVFGLGLNMGGVGTVAYLALQGAREIIVTDIKTKEELAPSIEKLERYKNITWVLGQHRPEDFTTVDMVVKNPGIPWTNEYIKLAVTHGIPVEMDSSLFFRRCKNPIIGITGSKGKTTTSTLIAHVLTEAKRETVSVGISQVGVLGVLDQITPESQVVFELSSWRLSALAHIRKSPAIAVLTNIYPDHQNYYHSMEAYMADKAQIFLHQKASGICIANWDNALVREMVQDAPGTVLWFSTTGRVGGDGAWLEGEVLMLSHQGKEQALLPLSDVPLRGEHNVGNVLGAALAALASGLTIAEIRSGIMNFPGVPHRLEKVAEKEGITYYNDTAATIPDAAVASLRSFTEPVILIAGGSDKQLSFDDLAREIAHRPKKLILFRGEGTDRLLLALRPLLPLEERDRHFDIVDTMAEAIRLARESAVPGDVVLLSPGTASFGLFKNEFDRGEQFRAVVKAL